MKESRRKYGTRQLVRGGGPGKGGDSREKKRGEEAPERGGGWRQGRKPQSRFSCIPITVTCIKKWPNFEFLSKVGPLGVLFFFPLPSSGGISNFLLWSTQSDSCFHMSEPTNDVHPTLPNPKEK